MFSSKNINLSDYRNISYKLISKNKAKLREQVVFETGMKGHNREVEYARLLPFGTLVVDPGFQWDFGSGPAIDTPDVVIASLAHDALCRIDDRWNIGADFRRKADSYFRKVLKELGMGWFRRWYFWAAVRMYSLTK